MDQMNIFSNHIFIIGKSNIGSIVRSSEFWWCSRELAGISPRLGFHSLAQKKAIHLFKFGDISVANFSNGVVEDWGREGGGGGN